jgi:hypothetical protein
MSIAARQLLRACRSDESPAQLAVTFAVLFPYLDERQRRLLMAAEARGLGHGGIRGRRAGIRGE